MVYRLYVHPLAKYPGPLLWRISILPSLYYAWTGDRHLVVDKLHKRYGNALMLEIDLCITKFVPGKALRMEPNLVSICTPNAIKSESLNSLLRCTMANYVG